METIWANAAFPPDYSALRLKLKSYCCGHEINLCAVQSPYVLGGKATWDDFTTAVLLCSHSFEDGRRIIRNPRKATLFLWFWRLLLRFTLKPKLVEAEMDRFRGYLYSNAWTPEVNTHQTGVATHTLKAPRAYRIIPFLCSELGLTESQALNFPMARANAYYAAIADKDGKIDLTGGREEEAVLKYLEEMQERERIGEKVWDF